MNNKPVIEFPCEFPIKVVGINSQGFFEEIKRITESHFPGFSTEKMTFNASKNNNYLAITVVVLAQNQDSLDAFYRQLSNHPQVKMVL